MTTVSPAGLELRAGPLRLAVRPDLGGCMAGLWHDGTPVMRSAEPAEMQTSRPSASFPLVPYSNRLGHRRFDWQGAPYTTAPNFGDSPHSLHGVAWLRAWDVVSADEHELVLHYEHQPDEHWPFAFNVHQHFALSTTQLSVRLAFTNTAGLVQPVGLGWHPYFPKRPHSRLQARVSSRWERDAVQLPTQSVAYAGIDDDIAHLHVDHCFDGWDGTAYIRDGLFALALSSSLRRLVVYTPGDKDYFCVEPVSHVNNAIRMPDPTRHGLIALPPGDSTAAWMKLDVTLL
jgi:aldose 1-epimerase